MEQFWKDAGNTTLYQNWWGGVVAGLLSAGGIYDDSPTLKFLTKQFKNYTHMQREVSIGLTDVLSGDYKQFTEDTMSNNDDLL
jgi:hypothetical protein